MNRRDFIRAAALAGVFAAPGRGTLDPRAVAATAGDTPSPPAGPGAGGGIIDTNVYVSRWPFRRVWADETPALVGMLREHGVTAAWTGSLDSLQHWDIGAVNHRLAEECATHGGGILVPFGAVNPMLPDWEEDIRRCQEDYRMPGLRLHPNFHGYGLDSPVFARLLDLATERGLIVQVALTMDDERTQHPQMRIPDVFPEPLLGLLKSRPRARVVLLNSMRRINPVLIRRLTADCPQVSFDISTLEDVAGIARELEAVRGLRLVFGSYAPVFIFESAELKLRESSLPAAELAEINRGRASALLNRSFT